jgi:hypothetical protein
VIRLLVVTVLLAAAPGLAAQASSQAFASVDVSYDPPSGPLEEDSANDSGAGAASAATGVGPSSGDAAAYAQEGIMRAAAFNSRAGDTSTANASAVATFTDTFTANAPGFAGQHASMKIQMEIEGFLDPLGGTIASLGYRLQINGGQTQVNNRFNVVYEGADVAAGVMPYIQFILYDDEYSWLPGSPFYISTLREIEFEFDMGAEIEIIGRLEATAASSGLDGGSADVNFFNTARWKGVSSLRAADPVSGLMVDVPLDQLEMLSGSGADYRYEIVPETEGGVLAMLGALVLVVRSRARCH